MLGIIDTPAGYMDETALYVFPITLSANQPLVDLSRSIDKDSDFLFMRLYGTQTGPYSINIRNSRRVNIANTQVRNSNLVGTVTAPSMFAPIKYVGGSSIQMDMTDLSGATNVIELIFAGVRRYQTS